MIGWADRYATLAGRACCAGRSWVGLDRSLARHQETCHPSETVTDDAGFYVSGLDRRQQPHEASEAETDDARLHA
jgi:hypothetical protein